jgi:hypothetical protein
MPALPLANTFESGQPDTTVITTGNSGGAAGTAFNAVTGSPTFSTAQVKNGERSMRFDTTGTYAQTHCDWTALGSITTSVWIRFYLYLTANPVTTVPRMICIRTSGAANSVFLAMTTGGLLQVLNAAQAGAATGSVAVALNQWVRIEARFLSSTTVGEGEWWLYNNPDAGIDSPSDHNSATSMVNGANSDGIQWGPTTVTGPANFVGEIDDVAISSAGRIGTGAPPPVPSWVPRRMPLGV